MTKLGRNVFDLSHDLKMACNWGDLVPVMNLAVIPGDKMTIGCESLIRLAPMVNPVMHRMDAFVHYFFVPNRLIWQSWEKYITNTPVLGALPAHPFIHVAQDNWVKGGVLDYMGISEPLPSTALAINALPLAAYQLIYNEYYRDQNLSTPSAYMLADGNNTANVDLRAMRKRAWEHDYYTAALPFAQKGAAVDIPIGNFNDVDVKIHRPGELDNAAYWDATDIPGGGTNSVGAEYGIKDEDPIDVGYLYAETSNLQPESTSINDLRRAFRLQEWLEKAARGGSRYVENILSFFGVRSQDMRLQRPEYITGTKTPISISEVLNTTGTEDAPQGNMAGHGIAVNTGKYGTYVAKEHGFIIGIMSIRPRTAYSQAIDKEWLKINSPFEYYWPQFANIGEQEVLSKEVFPFQTGTLGDRVFGYVPRYSEYKFKQSRVAGDFRDTLDSWHLARNFATAPALNQEFIECNPDERIFAVQDEEVQKFWCHVLHKIKAVRSMPKYGTPSF